MARQELVSYVLTCDVGGEEIPASEAGNVARSVSFDGSEYTVDLCGLHRGELDDALNALRVFVDAGQRQPVGRGRRAGPAAKVSRSTKSKRARPGPKGAGRSTNAGAAGIAAIRAWGQANGYKVGDRGRIPATVVVAYAARGTETATPAVPKRRPRKAKVAAAEQ